MTNTFKIESINSIWSEREDEDIDDVEDESLNSSQDEFQTLPTEVREAAAGRPGPSGDAGYPPSLCRLCAAQTVDPIYIYSEFGESMKLANKINNCLSVKVKKTDPLPKQLCYLCVENLNWCQDFDTQCINAEETLATMLRENPDKIDNDDDDDDDNNSSSISKEKSCPLCISGHMRTGGILEPENCVTRTEMDVYDSDIVVDSSDEEKALLDHVNEQGQHTPEGNSIRLRCLGLGSQQQYLKCGACMNLYHTKESLESHKCKPNVVSPAGTAGNNPYKCLVCNVTFTFEERLDFHNEQFHAEASKGLYCEICNITFAKELKLFYHFKRYHCEKSGVSCLQCGKLFPAQQELKLHVCVDGKTRPHVCDICNKGFSDGYTLKRHIVTHLPEKPYKCSQCSKSFTQKSRLNKHVASHGLAIENLQRAWKCVRCGEIFDAFNEADAHCRANHQDKISLVEELSTSKIYHCEFCNSCFNDVDSLREHRTRDHVAENPYTCNICRTSYKSFAEAVAHWKEHPRGFRVATAYQCDVCAKETKELSLLYKHKRKRLHFTARRTGENEQRYLCELCGRGFEKSEEIAGHGQEQCSKFPCDICGSQLPTANSLHAHKRRHSGLRPYVCNICGKSYTQSSHMWTHKRFHMGVKPYACEYCDQRFTIKPDLADHTRKKHTRERPFKCDVCNKAFLTGSVFYQHRLIHRGDRRYKCHYCEKAFTRTEALNNHIKIHTGEKPHACDVCGRCFRQKGDMRKHRRTQHNTAELLPKPEAALNC